MKTNSPRPALLQAAYDADAAFQIELVRAYGAANAADARYRHVHADPAVQAAARAKVMADAAAFFVPSTVRVLPGQVDAAGKIICCAFHAAGGAGRFPCGQAHAPQIIKTTIRRTGCGAELRVLAYTNAGRYPAGDYFTDDKQDAMDTAERMIEPLALVADGAVVRQ